MAFTIKVKMRNIVSIVLVLSGLAPLTAGVIIGPDTDWSSNLRETHQDTIPLQDRYGDFINDDTYNPFDILPSDIEQTVEYDPETDSYVVYERIGDEYFRTPTTMTFNEYLDWKNKESERNYFRKLGDLGDQTRSKSGKLDPMSKIDIEKNLIDRLFGGNGLTIKPQGNIDLNFGARYTKVDNPQIQLQQQSVLAVPTFDMDIKMSVDGKIGDKLDLGFNYDTQASFDFDREIKLAYDSEKWTDDDILKKIEAGNVSLPLRSSLIQGAQELFGIKTELQFGHLTLTGIASQQRSEQETIQIQNGATVQEFEIRPEEYDENRHFFLSHYNRNTYENSLKNLPYIDNSFRILNIEVWISDDRGNYQTDQTMICALADIAETEVFSQAEPLRQFELETDEDFINLTSDVNGQETFRLPENRVNTLFQEVIETPGIERICDSNQAFEAQFGMQAGTDFEIFRGRKLSQGEYFYNAELGFISLNVRLRPNQVLSVSYEYTFTENCDELYKVGSISDEGQVSDSDSTGMVQPEGVIFTKMLKNSSQSLTHPNWDLMMKNVYPIRANNLDQTDFEFDIFYENDSDGSLSKLLPIPGLEFDPILNILGLDNLNSRNDPQPDGIFDFVPGITVVPQNSSIIFPVLEPFGSALKEAIAENAVGTPNQINGFQTAFTFEDLYDNSVIAASQQLVQNKFVMVGKVKSSSSSEYSLGAWNIPQGSVRVTAGSVELTEGVHYEVDYGIGRVRILDQALLQQGVPVNISFEDNSVFSLQQKNMIGLRAEYEFSDDFYLGGTFLRLRERPFTQKVNIGDDPISNRVFGLDMAYNKQSDFLTKVVDKLPFYSTNVPSAISFSAEVAALKPGHNGAINNDQNQQDDSGIVSLDDFEGAVSGFPLSSQPNRWILASVPRNRNRFPGGNNIDTINLNAGKNRAKLSWYVIDRFVDIDDNVKNGNAFTRRVTQTDLFNRQLDQGVLPDLLTFDMTYYPDERGPYNFDTPDGSAVSAGLDGYKENGALKLAAPEERWAGIMRYMNNNDFQLANYEFIDFWLLNPYGPNVDGSEHLPDEEGFLTFHLGSVSEDILPDNKQFFENSLPNDVDDIPTSRTIWGEVPLSTPLIEAFAGTNFEDQDVGLDGMSDSLEQIVRADWFEEINTAYGITNRDEVQQTRLDPSGDNFTFFNDPNVFDRNTNTDLLERYKNNNSPENNSPDISNNSTNNFQRGNPIPDKEDLNNNRSLDQSEKYYEYRIPIRNNGGVLDLNNEFIRDSRTVTSTAGEEQWYRFRIPLAQGDTIGGIDGFRSIQFIRMIMEEFSTQKTFRMADFELVRNQWRREPVICARDGVVLDIPFSTDIVGVEENQSKLPFGYVIPPGIKQEQLFNTFSPVNQDENSMVLRFDSLPAPTNELSTCVASVTKLTQLDLRVYDRMEMFVHGERLPSDLNLEDDDLSVFVRIGKDFTSHFYEYEIPLKLSDETLPTCGPDCVWPEENKLDFPLEWFIQAKKIRNVLEIPVNEPFIIDGDFVDNDLPGLAAQFETINGDLELPEGHRVRIIGNPNLGRVKGMNVGARNRDATAVHGAEIWVNELRLAGLQERGGVAALARADIQLADLGAITSSASYSSLGWGALDQKVDERAKEENIEYDVAANLELGKFFPKNWGIRMPFYGQYAQSIINPEFDAYDFDITVEDEFDLRPTETTEVQARNRTVNTIKTFNLTNVRKERVNQDRGNQSAAAQQARQAAGRAGATTIADGSGKKKKKERKPMPWNIENFSASYSYTEREYSDPIIEQDNSVDQTLGLDYNFSRRGGYIEPFKKVKSKHLKLIKEFNFNLIPNSLSFNSSINRYFSSRKFRIPDTPELTFDDRQFNWERRYDLNWNLTKALKLNFDAFNVSYIDEVRQVGIAETAENRPWVAFAEDSRGYLTKQDFSDDATPEFVENYWKDNLKNGGRNTNYDHSIGVTYKLPIRYLPFMDWVDITANYRSTFNWSAGALILDSQGTPLPGIIQNSQNRSLTANLNFDKLYKKSDYVKGLDKSKRTKTSKRKRGDSVTVANDKDGKRVAKKKARQASTIEKLLVRPLFSLRSARITFKEDFTTVIPGYTETPDYFGLDSWNAPGVGFVLGLQPNIDANNPNNFLDRAANSEWITSSSGFNQETVQMRNQSYEAKFKIEPWKDFKIDVDFRKNHRETHSEVFKQLDTTEKDSTAVPTSTFSDFSRLASRDFGSFDMTYYNVNTLFGNDIDDLFNTFLVNRVTISNRLGQTSNPIDNETRHEIDGESYARGYGKLSTRVVVPAFIAAYTNTDASLVDLDLEAQVSKRSYIPKPNWTLRYDGLSKLPWFKDRFSSFTLEHAYSNTFRVSRFESDLQFGERDELGLLSTKQNGNYYTRLEIPAVQISEKFSPVLGLKMKTRTDFTMEFSYDKGRDLNLSISSAAQLEEVSNESWAVGVGYTIKDSNFLKKKKGKNARKSRSEKDDEEKSDDNNDRTRNSRTVTTTRSSDMTFLLNVSFNDMRTFVHEIDRQQETEPLRGNSSFQISPSVDYILNENVTLRAFIDYNTNTTFGQTIMGNQAIEGGITVRMTLK